LQNIFSIPLLAEPVGFNQYLLPKKVVGIFISIGFYSPVHEKKMTDYTVIYLNSWGEMQQKSVHLDQGFSSEKQVIKDVMNRLGIKELMPDQIVCFTKNQ